MDAWSRMVTAGTTPEEVNEIEPRRPADKDCETIPLLKWRLDRYVLKTGRVSVVRATTPTVARTTRRFAGASTTRSTARVSADSQGPAVMEGTKENLSLIHIS